MRTRADAAHQGRLRFLMAGGEASGEAGGVDPPAWAASVAAAAAFLEERAQGRHQEGALALGLRSAAMVHDLRNRLTLVSLNYQREQMEGGVWSGETARLLQETRSMCAAFLPEDGGGSMPSRLELRPLLLRAATNSAAMVRTASDARLRVRCRADLVVEADPVLLMRVVENLMVNALEASANGQVVACEGHEVSAGVEIRVEDEGRGMHAEGLQRAFSPGASSSHGTGFVR